MSRTLPARLVEVVGSRPDIAVAAPGRANLIGEHTDYNDGFVLPVALELTTVVAGQRAEGRLRLTSLDQPGEVEVDLETGAGPTRGWGRYPRAVVRALRDEGLALHGFEGALASDVPPGAGLSSSAALEIAVARVLIEDDVDSVRLARACRRAENKYVGVQTGIMDQLASAGARAGRALLIDCEAESFTHVPVPRELTVLVLDSGVRRELGDSGYNQRRSECRAAADALGVASLRHARLDDLGRLDGDLRARARHVVSENGRVLEAASALEAGETGRLGELFSASHASLRDDFAASTPDIDILVDVAGAVDGVVGARLTGGGWGGCVVVLVQGSHVSEVAVIILQRYEGLTGRTGRFWISHPSDGAGPLATSPA
jgi:galactokinase